MIHHTIAHITNYSQVHKNLKRYCYKACGMPQPNPELPDLETLRRHVAYIRHYVRCTFRSHLSFSWFALGLHTNKDWCVRWLEMKRYNRNNTSRVCTCGWIKITFIGWIFVQPIFAANQGFKSLWRHRASIVAKNPTSQAKCGFRRNGA